MGCLLTTEELVKQEMADAAGLWDAIKVVAKYYPQLPTLEAMQYAQQLFYDNCQGSGFRIINPIWPKGDREHREPCPGCGACRDEED